MITQSRLGELDALERQYRSIPFEAILKQDVLRLGLQFEDASLAGQDFKAKDYFIFTFDHVPLAEQSSNIRFRVPEEIKISEGRFGLLPTIVSVRVNPESPYIVRATPHGVRLFLESTDLGRVEFPPLPGWYSKKTSSGKLPGEVAPVIEWGYLIYITAFRNCQYFGREEECAFCDINHNYRQQKHEGRPYTGVKDTADILEVLGWIADSDSVSRAYTITGGSVTTQLRGKNEVDFYLEYARAIEDKFPGRWIGKVVTQAWEKEEVKKFKDAGIQIYHPNYEVWDKDLFEKICPGKTRYVGRDTWIRRIVESAEIMGPANVIPNFVGGVELSKPWGFTTVDEAVASTAVGLEFFMSKGIAPRFTTWCPEPYTTLTTAAEQTPVPLEYFCKLLTVWKSIHEKHGLPVPPGYGEPGQGKAVFSVSAFMDVIGYKGR